jgi:hypothetical protein
MPPDRIACDKLWEYWRDLWTDTHKIELKGTPAKVLSVIAHWICSDRGFTAKFEKQLKDTHIATNPYFTLSKHHIIKIFEYAICGYWGGESEIIPDIVEDCELD